MNQPLFLSAGLAIVLAAGYAHGLWTERWKASEEPRIWAARLQNVPATIEAWEGEDQELEPEQVKVAAISGYLMRRYVHRQTKESVSIILVCGRPGPVSKHTPDVCYGGQGYQVTPAVKYVPTPSAGADADEFWTARFYKGSSVTGSQQRISWAWSAAGPWTASENPRWQWGRSPALYKLYVIHPFSGGADTQDKNPSVTFLRALLPELRKALFTPADFSL